MIIYIFKKHIRQNVHLNALLMQSSTCWADYTLLSEDVYDRKSQSHFMFISEFK